LLVTLAVGQVVEFACKTRMQKDKLDDVVNGMLGSSLGKGLTEAERVQMVEMFKSQSETAAAATAASEGTAAGRHAARVEFKKKTGNEAFKAADYQQAAVAYTEALALIASAPQDCGEEVVVPPAQTAAIRCNRAACFLKLGRYAQAREDAQAATDLQPTYAKAHFRLALAQQAEDDFGGACTSFNKVLQLEPKNKEARAGLRMAEVQAERKRRQEAA
jgi:tetratricopeptide (TPR) repeat protein